MAADREATALPTAVVAAIHAAFTSEPPRRRELFAAGADDGDADEIRRKLRGKRWTAASRRLAIEERSAINWFSDAARHHYLPLWLLASPHDGLVRMWTASHLKQTAENEKMRASVLELYSVAERRAVVAFLEWLRETDERDLAEQALPWWTAAAARD